MGNRCPPVSAHRPGGAPVSPTNRQATSGLRPADHAALDQPPAFVGPAVSIKPPKPDRPQAALGGGTSVAARPAEHCGLDSGLVGEDCSPGSAPADNSARPGPGLVSSETSVTVHRQDARLKRMRRGVLTSARLMREDLERGGFRCRAAMLTLTYRPDADWDRKQVTALVRQVREYLRRRGHRCRYVWVLETTRAGKPHYHLLFWLPRGITLPKPDKRGWWPHGWSKIEWARNPVGYLAKYASKGSEHPFPPGSRLHGNGGLSPESRAERAWWMAPGWLREVSTPVDRPARAPGGGWLLRRTGEWLPSPWVLVDRAVDWSWCRFQLREVSL